MLRYVRLALGAGVLLVLVAGTVLATRTPHATPHVPAAASHEPEGPPTADDLGHAVDQLKASGIDTTAGQLQALAADYGLGGAVRLLAWADASGKSLDDLKAMRDTGDGWGQIAHALGLNPGIGSIMGEGEGHGPGGAAEHSNGNTGQAGKDHHDADESPEAHESPGD
jgi:hypothetical protein